MGGQPIALVGLPGVGKSTIGRRLAALLTRPFADTDVMVEQRAGCSIQELFRIAGEERFRSLESDALATALERVDPETGAVVATGGGIVLAARNRDLLRTAATVVYLHASAPSLVSRVAGHARRPLLAGGDVEGKLLQLYVDRDPLYRLVAHHVLEADRSTGRRLAASVAALFENSPVDG